MRKIKHKFIFLSLFILLVLIPIKSNALENPVRKDITSNTSICNFKVLEKKLWIDHVSWTRSFIISDLASLEDNNSVVDRLLRNQDEIGNSIKPYYGEEAGNKFASLLKEHIQIGGQVIDAAKASNKDELEKYSKLWYKNADEIAKFLNNLNPYYSYDTIKDMLYTHLKLVTEQVVSRLNEDWNKDIEAYDKNEAHMINFADIIINGIIKQYPQKFQS
ncbi:MAG: glycosyltransferase [Peptostreptococcaceae bacterium]